MKIDYRLHGITSKYILQRVTPEGRRLYVSFDDIAEVEIWYNGLDYKVVAEVIPEGPQKLRFDLDDKGAESYDSKLQRATEVIECLVTYIHTSLGNVRAMVFDISKRSDNIVSFHIVVDDVYVATSAEARQFCQNAMTTVTKRHQKIIDTEVYKTSQFFRLMGSTKYGEQRYKRPQEPCSFRDSMCSYTAGCRKVEIKVSPSVSRSVPVSVPHSFVPGDFRIRSVSGRLICLDRLRPTYCPPCGRIHHNENPYVVTGAKYVFYCRRNPRGVDIDEETMKSYGWF